MAHYSITLFYAGMITTGFAAACYILHAMGVWVG